MGIRPKLSFPARGKQGLADKILSIYAFDTFLSVYLASRSLKLACALACLSSPSQKNIFRGAMAMIRNGCPPQKAIMLCAQSSQMGSEWLKAVIVGGGTDLAALQSEVCSEMMHLMLKAEDEMAFVIVAATLFPVVASIAAILWGYGTSPYLFLIVLAQVSIFVVVRLWFIDLPSQI